MNTSHMNEILAKTQPLTADLMYGRFFTAENDQQFNRRAPQNIEGKGTVDPRYLLMSHLYLARFFANVELVETREVVASQKAVLPSIGTSQPSPSEILPKSAVAPAPVQANQEKPASFLGRLKVGLKRTRTQFTQGLSQLFNRDRVLGQDFFDDLETQLIMADVGITTTNAIITELKKFSAMQDVFQHENGHALLKEKLESLLVNTLAFSAPISDQADAKAVHSPEMILVVGVNGVGKTTTIGKLAQQSKKAGKSVMLAAGDTFRAAAVEQLQVWGERTGVQVISQGQGSDSASVIYDALQSAQAKKIDVLIADTAGRLHNKSNLMNELQKIVRVVKKLDASAPHKVLLVVDGCTGQNALSQGREFNAAVGLTGLVVTKLDGTAKGGILFALSQSLGVPVEYIGIGEGVDDLRQFDANAYVKALLDFDETTPGLES